MRLNSLRARLLVGVMALAAVCLVAVGAILYFEQRDFLVERVDEQTRTAVPLVTRALLVEEAMEHGGRRIVPGLGGPIIRDAPDGPGGPPGLSLPPGVYGERRDAAGTPLSSILIAYDQRAAARPDLPADLEPGEIVTVPSQDGTVDYRAAATTLPGDAGTTVVAVPLAGVDEQLDRLLLARAPSSAACCCSWRSPAGGSSRRRSSRWTASARRPGRSRPATSRSASLPPTRRPRSAASA